MRGSGTELRAASWAHSVAIRLSRRREAYPAACAFRTPSSTASCVAKIRRSVGFPLSLASAMPSCISLEQAIPLKPGAAELLAALTLRGLKLAIATSARRESAERHLRRSTLHNHIPVLVTRDDVARGKPCPDVFLRAAERSAFRPARAWRSRTLSTASAPPTPRA